MNFNSRSLTVAYNKKAKSIFLFVQISLDRVLMLMQKKYGYTDADERRWRKERDVLSILTRCVLLVIFEVKVFKTVLHHPKLFQTSS